MAATDLCITKCAKPFYATTEKKLSVPMRIFIKGFKSIAEGQYVALGKKLTFLVGPNSAGKSAIYAAISKLRQDAPLFELDVPSLHYKGKENNRALIQALGVEWEDEGNTIESRTTYVFYDFVDGEERMANGVNEGLRGAAQYFGDIFRDSESDDLFYRYLRWDSLKKNDFWNFEKITHERSDGKDRALSSFWSEFWNFEFDINEGSVFGLTEDVEGIVFVNAINFVKDMVPSAGAKNDPGLNELVKIFFSSVDDGFLRWNPALIKGIIFEIAKDREKQRLLNQFGQALLHKPEASRDNPSPRRSYATAGTGTVAGRPSCVKRLSKATRTCSSVTWRSNVRAITRSPKRLKQCILVSTRLLR